MPSPVAAFLPFTCPRKRSSRTRSFSSGQITFIAFLLAAIGHEARAESGGGPRQFPSQGPPTPSPPRAKTIPRDELLVLEPHNFARVIESLATSQGQVGLTTSASSRAGGLNPRLLGQRQMTSTCEASTLFQHLHTAECCIFSEPF